MRDRLEQFQDQRRSSKYALHVLLILYHSHQINVNSLIIVDVKRHSDYNLMIEFSRKRERLLESSLAENIAFRQKMEQEEQKTPILHPQNGAIKSLLENLLLQAKAQRVSYETGNIRDTPRFLVESLDDSMDLQ
jgi:hypothetical protein